MDNLRLGFQLTEDVEATLALSEAGSGVQSGVLLALHRLEQKATENPDTQFILAVEEPEAFLHPQKQKELYQDISSARSANLSVVITTHSPFIVSETPFSRLGLVKKDGQYSTLYVADIKDKREEEMFDAYSNDMNSQIFFADRMIFVEGESDARVIKFLLERKFGRAAHRVSVISAAGNKNFSPFLKMLRAWSAAKLPHLVVTDFDSLTKSSERAILVGAKAAGYALTGESTFHTKVDAALDKGEAEFRAVAIDATAQFAAAGLAVFVFTSDLEHSLVTADNKNAAAAVLTKEATNGVDYSTGYDLNAIRRQIGSKGVPLNPMDKPPFKKPYIHRKIAETIDLSKSHSDIERLLMAIDSL